MASRKSLKRWVVVLGAGFCLTTATSCEVSQTTNVGSGSGGSHDTGGTTGSGGSGSGGTSAGRTSGT
jgi:hypothetical protein